MSAIEAPRRVWLCADDYGISPGVNRSIRALIALGRLNATSVMMVGHAIQSDEIAALIAVAKDQPGCAIGLHVTLTAPFSPMTMYYRPLNDGLFPGLNATLVRAMLRRFDREIVRAEVAMQIAAFKAQFGRAPDYLDGHQHVQIFPQIRDAFLAAAAEHAPSAWVRQCGRPASAATTIGGLKARLLDSMSAAFRRKAKRRGVAFNTAFDGAYDYSRPTGFGALLEAFLRDMPTNGLVMCHPGHVDDTLRALDPFTEQREREHEFLASDAFPALLNRLNVTVT